MVNSKNIRIGIDVGGTFTHAVAIDGGTYELIGKVKVPTTHTAKEGVALGIIDSLKQLLSELSISPDNVSFIAHSTTQATNALLEGDVAPVGILGMGKDKHLSMMHTNVGKIMLAPGKFLPTYHHFMDTSNKVTDEAIKGVINSLVEQGAKAIAISESFSVDDPENEMQALKIANEMGIYATAGSQISQLYGLKIRTTTAVINASMLPKMIESADMTEQSVRKAGIKAPVMIMRSDGGVMDIDSMRKRPILTLLSGPAAGVAAAMMYLHISDGIFLEVGGTSTDISAIKNGKAQVKTAEIGGRKIYLRTLDVRTLGIAGGSIPRVQNKTIVDVGPRSAHIAGLGYASFLPPLKNAQGKLFQPQNGDPQDYLAFSEGESKSSLCITPTCAANMMGLVPDDNCAKGNPESINKIFEAATKVVNKDAKGIAQTILDIASNKCYPTVSQLMKEYKLDQDMVSLIGGGGGAAAIVPALAKKMEMKHSLAQNADVLSAIGVALALLRETVERQIINPTSEDILKVRNDAYNAVQNMGADVKTIEVQVEIDSQSNIVRAIACGAVGFADTKQLSKPLTKDERTNLVADSMHIDSKLVKLICEIEHFQVYGADLAPKGLEAIFVRHIHSLRILDDKGIIRLQVKNGIEKQSTVQTIADVISDLVEEHAKFGDAGRIIPSLMLLAGPKIIDLTGLLDLSQILALIKVELESMSKETSVIVIANLSN